MKSFLGTIAVFVLAASIGFASDDFGPFATARSAWPDAFVPGKVATIDFAGEELYAFAGEAESFFEGEFAESESELREEAILDAKANFFEVMTEGDHTRTVSLSGLRVAYRWREESFYFVVCVVPRRNVRVSPKTAPSAVSSSPLPATSSPSTPVAAPPPVVSPSAGERGTPKTEKSTIVNSSGDAPWMDDRIRALRKRLVANPDDPLPRLELARFYAQSGDSGRAVRHYEALARKLAEKPSVMADHEAAASMVEAAEYAQSAGNEAKALKFYRVGWRRHDPELQQRITTAISLLRLHVD